MLRAALSYYFNTHICLRTAWALVLVILAIDIIWILSTDVGFVQETLIWIVPLAMLAWYVSEHILKSETVKTLVAGYVFLCVAWPALRIFNHLMFTQTGEYIDTILSRADEAMGLSWMSYVSVVDGYPLLVSALSLSYTSLTLVSIVAFVTVSVFVGRNAVFEFLLLFVALAIVVSVLGVVFPALGPMAYYTDHLQSLAFVQAAGVEHLPYYEDLRTNAAPVLRLENLPGLTTFPSFHTAMGVLLIYCCRERWLLLVPAVTYAVTMIAAAVVYGSHYFVDILAGGMLALLAILVLRMTLRSPFAAVARKVSQETSSAKA